MHTLASSRDRLYDRHPMRLYVRNQSDGNIADTEAIIADFYEFFIFLADVRLRDLIK